MTGGTFTPSTLDPSLRVHHSDPKGKMDPNVITGLRWNRFPYAYPVDPVKLATTYSSLANVSGIVKQP